MMPFGLCKSHPHKVDKKMRSEFSALELAGFSNKEPKSHYIKNNTIKCVVVQSQSVSGSFLTPCTLACQASLSTGFPRPEYWSGLPFSSPRDLLDPGIKPESCIASSSLLLSHHRNPTVKSIFFLFAPSSNRSDLIKQC